MRQTVVGVFDQYATAQRAAAALAAHGIARDHIHVTGATDEQARGAQSASGSERYAGGEGVVGSIRSFFSEVFGGDEHHSHLDEYSEAVKRGGAVVKVDADEEGEVEQARTMLMREGAVDIDQRVAQWRNDETSGASGAASMRNATASQDGEQRVPIVKESLEVGKRNVNTGGVRVYARTIEEPVDKSVSLRTEKATVDRRAVDRAATDADLATFKDRTIEVRENSERAVVGKTARVVEEVVVGKNVQTQQKNIRDTVRSTDVRVEQLGGESAGGEQGSTSSSMRPYADYEPSFRQHFQQNRATMSDGAFSDYEPAYRYGHGLGGDERYRGQQWDAIEPHARREWEQQHAASGGTWSRVKATVRHAWERVTS